MHTLRNGIRHNEWARRSWWARNNKHEDRDWGRLKRRPWRAQEKPHASVASNAGSSGGNGTMQSQCQTCSRPRTTAPLPYHYRMDAYEPVSPGSAIPRVLRPEPLAAPPTPDLELTIPTGSGNNGCWGGYTCQGREEENIPGSFKVISPGQDGHHHHVTFLGAMIHENLHLMKTSF